jgi:hypothetical protein
MSSAFSLSGVRIYAHGTAGGPAYATAEKIWTGDSGTLSTGSPLFCASAVTLLSTVSGRSARGRNYVPVHATTDNSGEFANGIADDLAVAHASLIGSINAQDWTAYHCTFHKGVIVSKKLANFFDVTSVRVDSKPDTQHRRTNSLSRGYTKSTGI